MASIIPIKQKIFELTQAEEQALNRLIRKGYPFPARTEVAVIRKMIAETWAREFPGEPFPNPQEDENE